VRRGGGGKLAFDAVEAVLVSRRFVAVDCGFPLAGQNI
jgi:hypothetical protein